MKLPSDVNGLFAGEETQGYVVFKSNMCIYTYVYLS